MAALAVLVSCAVSVSCSSSPQSREAKYLKRGEALLESKDYSRAILEFSNAAKAMPKDAEPHYRMALAYLDLGDYANGVPALRKATELNPRHEQARLKLAELMASTNNKELLEQAATQLEGILTAAPDNFDANDALALAEWRLGKTDEAVVRLEATLRKLPSRLQTSTQLARMKIAHNDLAGAEQVLTQAVASAPKSSDAELALGQFYMLYERPSEAEAHLRKAIALNPANGSALVGLGAIQVVGKRMDEADKTYRQVSALPGTDYKALHALFLYRTGKRDSALAEFEKLAHDDPADRGIRSRLFAVYLALGKNDAARDLLEAALKKNRRDGDALFERAELSLRTGKPMQAEADLKEVLHIRPDFAEGHVVMAAIDRARNQKEAERDELSKALQLNPGLLPARLALARIFTRTNHARAALDLLNATPPSEREAIAVIAERNWALLGAGETRELRSQLDKVLRVHRFPEMVIQDAVLRMQEGDFPRAQADAEEAIQFNAEDLRGPLLLAEACVAQKQNARAEERLEAIAAAHPRSAPLADFLGQWYLNAGNRAAARKEFEAAESANPAFPHAVLALASLDYQDQHVDAARKRLLRLTEADPNNVTAQLMLGTWAMQADNREEAVRRFRAALAVDGSNVDGLNDLAYVTAASDPDAALKYAEEAARIAPGNPAVEDTLGWIYYRKQVYARAVSYLEMAVAHDPTPRRQFHLAMSYLKSGNRDMGEKTLGQALQKDPKLTVTETGW